MDATTMAATNSLVKRLKADFPTLTFAKSNDFQWSPENRVVHYSTEVETWQASLLHETAHGALEHRDFSDDLTLIRLEREAWDYARERLSPQYEIEIPVSLIEDSLDSYRDWLHARSRCPHCHQTGLHKPDGSYACLLCQQKWRPNDARRCGLRRYKLS